MLDPADVDALVVYVRNVRLYDVTESGHAESCCGIDRGGWDGWVRNDKPCTCGYDAAVQVVEELDGMH